MFLHPTTTTGDRVALDRRGARSARAAGAGHDRDRAAMADELIVFSRTVA